MEKKTGESAKKGKSAEKTKVNAEENNKQPFVNKYGFIHLNAKLLEAIGAVKGAKTPLKIEAKDGTLVISKA
jgi:hypothetical protein